MPNAPKELHGNRAKIDPATPVVGRDITNAVTMPDHKKRGIPVVSDENVAFARKFAQENKK